MWLVACAITVLDGRSALSEVSEVRIGVQFGLVYLPVTIADAQGFFAQEARKAGLSEFKVNIRRFSGTPAINDALFSGSVDLGALGAPGLLIACDKTRGNLAGVAALGANALVLETNRPDLKVFTDLTEQDRLAVPASTSPQAIMMRMAAEKFYGPGQHARVDPLLVSMPTPRSDDCAAGGEGGDYGLRCNAALHRRAAQERQNSLGAHIEGHPGRRGSNRRYTQRIQAVY
jgi:NitT/TauT family transport system substrate-binding protein